MAIAVQWDNSDRNIIRWDFEQSWSWDELADSAKVSSAMIASVEEDVDVILNAVGSQPPKGKISTYQRSAFAYTPSNIRMIVLVSGETMSPVQIMMPFMQGLETAESLDEARTLLVMQPA
jgi:hypothetical protein